MGRARKLGIEYKYSRRDSLFSPRMAGMYGDVHDYDQNVQTFSVRYNNEHMEAGKVLMNFGGYKIKRPLHS